MVVSLLITNYMTQTITAYKDGLKVNSSRIGATIKI